MCDQGTLAHCWTEGPGVAPPATQRLYAREPTSFHFSALPSLGVIDGAFAVWKKATGVQRTCGLFFVIPFERAVGGYRRPVLAHKYIPSCIRYPQSHSLDTPVPDLESLRARCREPAEHQASHHLRREATGAQHSFGHAAPLTCVDQHFERSTPFGAERNFVHRHRLILVADLGAGKAWRLSLDIFKFESACTVSVRHRVWHHYATSATACDLAITGIGANPGTTSNAAPAPSFPRRERVVVEYADIDCAAGPAAGAANTSSLASVHGAPATRKGMISPNAASIRVETEPIESCGESVMRNSSTFNDHTRP